MKRYCIALLPAAAAALLALSTLPGCETLTETPGQNMNKVQRAVFINTMELPDDTEELLLIDRPSWLSRKPMPWY